MPYKRDTDNRGSTVQPQNWLPLILCILMQDQLLKTKTKLKSYSIVTQCRHRATRINRETQPNPRPSAVETIKQWFSNLSEVSNPTVVMQAYIEPLIITRSGSRKF